MSMCDQHNSFEIVSECGHNQCFKCISLSRDFYKCRICKKSLDDIKSYVLNDIYENLDVIPQKIGIFQNAIVTFTDGVKVFGVGTFITRFNLLITSSKLVGQIESLIGIYKSYKCNITVIYVNEKLGFAITKLSNYDKKPYEPYLYLGDISNIHEKFYRVIITKKLLNELPYWSQCRMELLKKDYNDGNYQFWKITNNYDKIKIGEPILDRNCRLIGLVIDINENETIVLPSEYIKEDLINYINSKQ